MKTALFLSDYDLSPVYYLCSFYMDNADLDFSDKAYIKELQKRLMSELGIKGFLGLYWNTLATKRKVFFRARKMKKKWPFQMPEEYLDMKISDLRETYGINILSEDELNYTPTKWSGSINS